MNFEKYFNGWTVLSAATLIVVLTFPAIVFHPNNTMFTYGGDGIKNYFTVLYYLRNNSGIHFMGMNYPFGEHLSFADAQPGLIVPFKWLINFIPSLSHYGLVLINYAVLLGLILGSLSVYLLLKQLGVRRLFAFCGALLITFLSPQLFRTESHFGLSYIFFFPMGWYLFLKAEEKTNLKWTVLSVLFIFYIGLLHFYLAAAVCLFLTGYSLLATITGFKKEKIKLLLLRFSIPVTAMLALQVFLRITDTVKDRPVKPWGFFYALANTKTVFLPHVSDLFGVELKETIGFNEGFAYVGLAVILFLVFYIPVVLVKLLLRKGLASIAPLKQNEIYFLITGFFILLFSMGVPFIWNMEGLIERLGFIRQFRGLGRFAWCFYYTSAVLAVVYYCRTYESIQKKTEKKFLAVSLSILCLIWSSEAYWRMKNLHAVNDAAAGNYLQFHNGNYKTLLAKNGVILSRYQAILSLPHHHIGSEKFSVDKWPSPYYAMKAAYHTGLPAFAVMLSRTSLLQSSLSMQLTGDTLLSKDLVAYLKPGKPLLVLTYGTQLLPSEQFLLQKAKLLVSDGEVSFYELGLDAFNKKDSEVIQLFQNKEALLQLHKNYWSNTDTSIAVLKYFDTTHTLSTASFVNESKVKQPMLLDTTLLGYKSGDTLNISLWIKIEPEKDALPILNIEEFNHGERINFNELPFKWSGDVYQNMVRVSKDIILKQNTSRIKLTLHQGSIFTNLLIRRKAETIFIPVKSGGFYYNNLPVDLK